MSNNHEEQIRIVQETVAGKEITFAHVMVVRRRSYIRNLV
jgi:ethanolamine utilization microcompartment shell protein EutS